MNQRFTILTFAACTVTFATIWAATAPTPHLAAARASAANAPVGVMYADCDAVRAAGAAPLRASQPGYRPALDPNMNGIACESVGVPNAGAAAPSPSDPAATDPGASQDMPQPPPPPVEQINPTPPGAAVEELPVLT